MKKNSFYIGIFLVCINLSVSAQNSKVLGGEVTTLEESKTQCLTDMQRNEIKKKIAENIKILRSKNQLNSDNTKGTSDVLFNWPIQTSSSSNYNEVWAISNYVDHNAAFPNQLSDYNCGTKTYDTASGYNHAGVDIFLWPFRWHQVENNIAEVVAAQEGQIVFKSDGNFDHSCSFNNNNWNAVYVEHSDGSTAWYGHMKNGSLTSKIVGDTVTQGEFLGIVASSGNSSGPHLHFEVYNSSNNLIDPYAGTCNNLNATTWWTNQKPYVDPNLNAALTHSAVPVFNGCPNVETTNLSDDFELNDNVIFAIYLREQQDGSTVNLKIIRPDNSVFGSWDHTFSNTYGVSYWYWTDRVNIAGQWKWEVTYYGKTVTHTFNVGNTANLNDATLNKTTIYPNPFNNAINISSKSNIVKASITNILGEEIKVINNLNEPIKVIELDNAYSKGMYFLTIESDLKEKKTFKILKN